ncbi:RICIN domain-containing protein [Kitasatospora viridis]|uniref:Ricin-type beta-trefoil lectin protein n=1 Tax=Kitasatospora viridis TaxID=281105 RepID=A0A561TWS2_9ACTN|nr:RICIN domain-containing protein [Kitasatospora viridis]TWF91552.1 ricin-type beta-trefoil lectin protein [Kitasatospora viridis]
MSAPRTRLAGGILAGALATAGLGSATATPAAAAATAPTAPSYSVTVGATGSYAYPTDTPASAYIDKDGTFYFQQSVSLYGATQARNWSFYTGTDFDHATRSPISDAVNPANSSDRNNDTTWRCNNSPTGLEATAAPSGSGYSQVNFCDLVGTWVDPDTGDWYGLVHDEFTPQPFGDGLHYDSIDYAKSTDQGRTWTIEGHAITSPYSTTRGDTTAFPNQTYDYGDGDPRLFVDTASGYFYVYYGSRIIPKGGVGGSNGGLAHVARAPISGKMAAGTWQKWYDGAWTQPGIGGLESNMVPVGSGNTTGYTPVGSDYSPATTGTVDQQVAAGTLPAKSDLFIMNIAYDAYLGLYIGEPEVVSGTAPQRFYVTRDLATQQWTLAGDTGSYTSGSWYRWLVDSGNLTSSNIIAKSFRSYCSISCASSDGEYADITVDSSAPAPAPVDLTKSYRISSGEGRVLAQVSGGSATTSGAAATGSALESWSFQADGDGSYRVVNSATGQLLGVDATSTANRAWGTAPTVTAAAGGSAAAGQQWFVLPAPGGSVQLVNRYSGLVIGLSAASGGLAETTPPRSWTDTTGSTVGGGRTPAQQELTLTATGSAPESVLVTGPGDQTTATGTGTTVSLQLTGTDTAGKALSFSATGLPAGLAISSTGLITGTPSTAGSATVTVTASSGTATGSTTFHWTVGSVLTGSHVLLSGGNALDDANGSTAAGNPLITWSPNGGSNQSWQFVQQSGGSYELVNGRSGLCADVYGGSSSAGATLDQWTCTAGTNQLWNLTQLPTGAYSVTSVRSGLALTAPASTGSTVTQQAYTGSTAQQWTLG